MKLPSGEFGREQPPPRPRHANECRQLTISLLQHDFGLKVEIPSDRLCPPVSVFAVKLQITRLRLTHTTGSKQVCGYFTSDKVQNSYISRHRLNYIIWVQDLLDSTTGSVHDTYDADREVVGLDVYVTTNAKSCKSGD